MAALVVMPFLLRNNRWLDAHPFPLLCAMIDKSLGIGFKMSADITHFFSLFSEMSW